MLEYYRKREPQTLLFGGCYGENGLRLVLVHHYRFVIYYVGFA